MQPNDQSLVPGPEGLDVTVLRDLIADTAGIADVEVDLREDGSPRLRIRLDGSVPGDDVGEEIRRRVAIAHSRVAGTRRNGLGRGLADIIAADAEVAAPAHLQPPVPEPESRPTLVLVAVEETAGGISVRAADSVGGVAFSPVEDPRSLNQAVVSAVGRLCERRPLPRLSGVEIRDVNGAPVLTVVLTLADGTRAVGAALVEGGMPFTLGTAVWEALASSD